MNKKPAILFVCTANICRSPMAAALFQAQLKKARPDWQEWQVDSAGTWGLDGEPAARNSRQVLAERGLDISSHRARTVEANLLKTYDLILTMEAGQKEALQIEFPFIAKRVFLLGEMDGSNAEVEDPYGRPVEAFEETVKKMDEMLEKGMRRILSLVVSKQLLQGAE